jgi:hypothetical protein
MGKGERMMIGWIILKRVERNAGESGERLRSERNSFHRENNPAHAIKYYDRIVEYTFMSRRKSISVVLPINIILIY